MENKPELKKIANWVDNYVKKGILIFNEPQIVFLRAVQRKYRADYLPFLVNLKATIGISRMHGVQEFRKVIDTLVPNTNNVIDLIDNLLMAKGATLATPTQIQDLFENIDAIEKAVPTLVKIVQEHSSIQKAVKSAEESTGVSLEGLAETHTKMGSKLKEITFKAPERGFAGGHPELAGLGKEVMGGIARSFGPYGTAAQWVGSAIGGYIKRGREAKIRKEAGALAAGLIPIEEEGPESILKLQEALLGGTKLNRGINPSALSGREYRTPLLGPSVLGMESKQVQSTQAKVSSASLFSFFNEGAYKAKWTRELFGLLSGKAGSTPETQGGNIFSKLGNLISMLGPALAALGPALAVIGTGLVAWKAGRWVGENVNVGGKSVDAWTQQGFEKVLGADKDTQFSRMTARTQEPIMKRAMEIQKQNPKILAPEAVKQARMERGLSTPDVSKMNEIIAKSQTPGPKEETKESALGTAFNESQSAMLAKLSEIHDSLKRTGGVNKRDLDIFNIKDPNIEWLNTGELGVS